MESQFALGRSTPMLMQYGINTCDLCLLAVHCQLQIICIFIHDNGDVEDIEIEAVRVIAHILFGLGLVLDNIEARADQDAEEIAGFEDTNHLTYVRSYFFDVREVVDDLIV
ncbi:hypothetical protein PG989_003276 [Apiospora arundinis]|uniref:Uncharacterized protein n=1 Tax=Apiospora arundinis TaxID=335852 RepID=A0ABR2I2R1_9PEZI